METKIFKANGEIITTTPKNGTDFQLEELQAIVGGWIEIVYLLDGRIIVVNEDGKCNGLPINENATKLLLEQGGWDCIVGDVLVCDASMVK